MDDSDVWPPTPQRTEPWHAVPDLDESIERAHLMRKLGDYRARKHAVPTTAPHYRVSVTLRPFRQPRCSRRAMNDIEASCGPAAHHFISVNFRATGIGVVEIAPGEYVHASYAKRFQITNDLG